MTTKNHTNFALLVHTCDRYQFLYRGFAAFFKKYWDFNIPCNYYFATEQLDVDMEGFQHIKSGAGQWSNRLAHLLRTGIAEKYVIYFQEDMWLNKPVNAAFFEELFRLIESNNWKQVKLTSSDVYKTLPAAYEIQGFTIAQLNNQQSGYLMSHQVTIWDREYLLAQLPNDEHPWRNERKGTKRLKKLNPEIYQVDYFAENGHPEINTNHKPMLRSEYQTVSENSALNHRVLPYIQELSTDAAQLNYAKELQQHFERQLTHDGQPKPRKEDLFKKIKNWLKGK